MEKINNLLEIILITYNRKTYLQNALKQLFADNSNVRNLQITVLDNASTDGSSELLKEYSLKYHNLKHIRHKKNIGGNANIARAFEIASLPYVWVICDDDEYDFSNFNELEQALDKKPAAVVVANYANPQKNKPLLFKQMSFVPSAVYRTDLIADTVLINANFNISNMFPQLAAAAAVLNSKKEIIILENPLVEMVVTCGEESYTRGVKNTCPHPLMKDMFWELGYLNSAQMILDTKLRKQIVKNMHPQNKSFYSVMVNVLRAAVKGRFRYLADFIFGLDFEHKIKAIILLPFIFIFYFYTTKNGIYICFFMRLKTKIIPFKK